MLGDAARLRFKRMDFGNLEVSELPPPRRLFRLSDLGVQIPDIGVHFPDMGVQIETIEVFRFERDAHMDLAEPRRVYTLRLESRYGLYN
jgi:hypothetical protein